MNFRKVTAGISALALTVSLASALPAFAESDSLKTVDDIVQWMDKKGDDAAFDRNHFNTSLAKYTVSDPANVPEAPAMEKFDLRDVNGKNYVSPVKFQNPYGTCWAFSITAAAETSVAHTIDFDFNAENEDEIDFSERHLAWFVAHPLPENKLYPSQAGEGLGSYKAEKIAAMEGTTLADYNTAFFNTGGYMGYGTTIYSSFQGPVLESTVPYGNNENTMEGTLFLNKYEDIMDEKPEQLELTFASKEERLALLREYGVTKTVDGKEVLKRCGSTENPDWWEGPGYYLYHEYKLAPSEKGDWSVDESLRFNSFMELEQSNILPCPCGITKEDGYFFNEAGVNAIKNELINGRAVSIAYRSDQSMPGQVTKAGSYMNFLDKDGNATTSREDAVIWCQYTYDKEYDSSNPDSINKVVEASHAVTIIGYDDTIPKEFFNDPNGTLAGDGAFIIKNSWDTDYGMDGYFYLSYYDQSLVAPESFSFRVLQKEDVADDLFSASNPQIYDLMPSDELDEVAFDDVVHMANVFTADTNLQINSVSYIAVTNNEKVHYDIVILNDDAASPEDGTLAGTAEEVYPIAGFQRTYLNEPVTIRKGQRYAIIVTAEREDGRYGIGFKGKVNKEGLEYYIAYNVKEIEKELENPDLPDEKLIEYFSMLDRYTTDTYAIAVVNEGESLLSVNGEWVDLTEVLEKKNQTEFGKMIDFDNFTIKAYTDSAVLDIVNTVDAPKESYKAGDVVDCTVHVTNPLKDSDLKNLDICLNGETLMRIDALAVGESVDIPYQYTVTGEDVQNGSFTTEVTAFMEKKGIRAELNLMKDFNPTVLVQEFAKPETPTEDVTDAGETTPTEETTSAEETTTTEETNPTAASYTEDRLCEMAVRDYEVKTGIAPSKAEAKETADGKYSITLTDTDGKVLDTYLIDQNTALGTDSEGKEVNLPQTGNTSPSTAAAAAAAAALTIAGAYLTVRSLRRKD